MYAHFAEELVEAVRSDLADTLEGVSADQPDSENLWKDRDLYRYMTVAIDATARATDTWIKAWRIPITQGVQNVPLPRSILEITGARLASTNAEVRQRNSGECDSRDDYGMQVVGGNTMYTTTGVPSGFFRDIAMKQIVLSCIPVADDTLIVEASATLAMPMVAGMALPFNDTPDLDLISTHMKYQAYRKHDADTLDMQKSDEYKAEFDAKAEDRKYKLMNHRRKPGLVRADW